jgi:hypothetical protein
VKDALTWQNGLEGHSRVMELACGRFRSSLRAEVYREALLPENRLEGRSRVINGHPRECRSRTPDSDRCPGLSIEVDKTGHLGLIWALFWACFG